MVQRGDAALPELSAIDGYRAVYLILWYFKTSSPVKKLGAARGVHVGEALAAPHEPRRGCRRC